MHLIGFSHHYTKLQFQTYGTLLAVRSTKALGNRPDACGMLYDTEYIARSEREFGEPVSPAVPVEYPIKRYYIFLPEDFDKPMLQLVFIGEKQIPFTTYRKIPENYTPWRKSRTFRKNLPYSDLIGQLFAFKFKGEKLPEGLANKVSLRKDSVCSPVRIFD